MNRRFAVPLLTVAVLPMLAGCGALPYLTHGVEETSEATAQAVASTEPAPTTPADPEGVQTIAITKALCDLPDSAIRDDGWTLVIDGQGKEDHAAGTLDDETLGCAIGSIGTPDSVIAKMEHTRAMDGVQEDADDVFEYSWTYHPDNGLDVIVTVIDDA